VTCDHCDETIQTPHATAQCAVCDLPFCEAQAGDAGTCVVCWDVIDGYLIPNRPRMEETR
jgi:hypothetical protein